MHAKVVIVGCDFAIIGSQNITSKSSSNKELSAVFYKPAEVARVSACIDDWTVHRSPITESALDQVLGQVAKLKSEFAELIAKINLKQLSWSIDSLRALLAEQENTFFKAADQDARLVNREVEHAHTLLNEKHDQFLRNLDTQREQFEVEAAETEQSIAEFEDAIENEQTSASDNLLAAYRADLATLRTHFSEPCPPNPQ